MLLPIKESAQRRESHVSVRPDQGETSHTEISNTVVVVIQCVFEHRNKLCHESLVWPAVSNRIAYRERGIARVSGILGFTEERFIPLHLPGDQRLFRPRGRRRSEGSGYQQSSNAIHRGHFRIRAIGLLMDSALCPRSWGSRLSIGLPTDEVELIDAAHTSMSRYKL
jgi:hypothetical protein